jgi:hypothetical protein
MGERTLYGFGFGVGMGLAFKLIPINRTREFSRGNGHKTN